MSILTALPDGRDDRVGKLRFAQRIMMSPPRVGRFFRHADIAPRLAAPRAVDEDALHVHPLADAFVIDATDSEMRASISSSGIWRIRPRQTGSCSQVFFFVTQQDRFTAEGCPPTDIVFMGVRASESFTSASADMLRTFVDREAALRDLHGKRHTSRLPAVLAVCLRVSLNISSPLSAMIDDLLPYASAATSAAIVLMESGCEG